MSKRLQIMLSDSAYETVEKTQKQAVDGFPQVKINFSDVIEAMIPNSKVNLTELRLKHTDLRRTLLDLAKRKDLSVEDIVNQMSELKGALGKKETKKLSKGEAEQGAS